MLNTQRLLLLAWDNLGVGIIVIITTRDKHYYDEDDIKVNKVQERVEVVAPASEPAKAEQPKPQLKPQPKRKRGDDNSLQLSLFGEL